MHSQVLIFSKNIFDFDGLIFSKMGENNNCLIQKVSSFAHSKKVSPSKRSKIFLEKTKHLYMHLSTQTSRAGNIFLTDSDYLFRL